MSLNQPTFLFYDYETFGIHTSLDKPAQFACIRTNINFDIIENPKCFYCFFSNDYLPDPHAILMTGITPQYTEKHGTNEYNFSKKIFNIFKQPKTCIIGYNNIHFDDEITRNIFYRNFFDPYEWSWKNGNSRWDILHLLRACYALRPEGIKWPKNDLDLPSFKLSDFTEINNITHAHAHDAMSDVYATIAIAKLIKNKQPKLFAFFFKMRKKSALYKLIDLNKSKPIVYVSNNFGAIRHNVSCILPIIWHKNKNILIAIDLFRDIEKLIFLCTQISFEDDFIKSLFNLGILLLHFNRCPTLAPIQCIRKEDISRLDFNFLLYYKKIRLLRKNKHIFENIKVMLSKEKEIVSSSNVDLKIYDAFFCMHDKKIINTIQKTSPSMLKNRTYHFYDYRLKKLLFRYRARNFYETLNKKEKKVWLKYCLNVLKPTILKEYVRKIENLLKEYSYDNKKIILLNSILFYVFHKYKKLFYENFNLS
ncbi:exodeoxyribonuclease I [Buchnera aphidicola (Diuraphis noxia)]|uniref:Exodeoxyribonuclease I n=1 Tax=Buchnera aphidicola subsp. Diuraphis noxia TaxID=118101 RepID=A0A1B2H936_BUCDN|nr:exodeoxyribonuclease I [Buchnera aphidicola]ANZ22735.1 exodeoxyribonuclease I [Buchnera aphidicola (Diuraphis noxia)]